FQEPFARLFTQGMITHPAYRCPEHGWIAPQQVREGRCPTGGEELEVSLQKMAKSKLNVVAPSAIIERFGADTERVFTLFVAPPEKESEWSDEGVRGASRFLTRVWRLVVGTAERLQGSDQASVVERAGSGEEVDAELARRTHRAIKKVTEDLGTAFHFNTAIAALMEFSNHLGGYVEHTARSAWNEVGLCRALTTLVILLHPFAPHITEEMWRVLGGDDSLLRQPWPDWDETALATDEISLVVTVNGKVRSKIRVPPGTGEADLRAAALADEKITRILAGKEPRKVIVVPDRLVNLVL
ncbi:MAG: class I tRNA ligase family protein, partial [Acidobacteriota bacterium]